MTKPTHTPGPWHIAKGRHTPRIIHEASSNEIAKMHAVSLGDMQANARLIAAAPDLLEACKELKAAFMDGCGEAKVGSEKRKRLETAGAKMEAAIAKAEGGAA